MTKMRYITIQEWMLELGIGGNDLMAYALVWGFCQDGRSCFRGSYDYLTRWLNCNRSTAIRVVKRLTELGLLRKELREMNGVQFCDLYALVPEGLQNATTSGKMTPSQWQKDTGGRGKMPPHNKSIDNATIVANRDNITPLPPFDFYRALLNNGVSEETAKAWLAVRKAKRCVNTELAFHETMEEVRKSGQSAEQCIRFSASRSWAGFKADWLEREQTAPASRPRKVDNVTYMVEQMEARMREQQRQCNPNDDLPDEQ